GISPLRAPAVPPDRDQRIPPPAHNAGRCQQGEICMTTQIAPAPMPATRNLNVALIIIALAQLMVVLDVAIVNVALPSIQRELHFAATDLEWVVNAYAIAFGGLLLFGGRAGDLFGRRRIFIVGALMFTAGSLAGGL